MLDQAASEVDTDGDEWEDSDIDIMGPDIGQTCRALRQSSTPTTISNTFVDICGECSRDEPDVEDFTFHT